MRDEKSTPVSFAQDGRASGFAAEVYRCRMRPDELADTATDNLKFCGHCQNHVYRVKDINGFTEAVAANRCIWIEPSDGLKDRCEVTMGMPILDRRSELSKDPALIRPLRELGLPARTLDILEAAGFALTGDLVNSTELELYAMPRLGRRSIQKVKEALASRGLTLGIKLSDWTP